MGKNKRQRFLEISKMNHVSEPKGQELLKGCFPLKGNWKKNCFSNQNPIVLELGCGKGEYTIGLAERTPGKNFIGIDIKGDRIWNAAKKALDYKLKNVHFLRSRIELLGHCFAESEVDELWITFPDPQIKFRRHKLILTHPNFLNIYRKFLKKEGIIHLKTDSEFLYGYTLGVLQSQNHCIIGANHDIYNRLYDREELTSIRTYYEKKYLELKKPIAYIQFKLERPLHNKQK